MMKCSDIENMLLGDGYDMEMVESHLKSCPACAARFMADFKIEKVLQGLAAMPGTIDITAEVRNKLLISQKTKRRLKFVRRWVWAAAFAASLVILILAAPTIPGWLIKAYKTGLAAIDRLEILGEVDIEAALLSNLADYLTLPLLICVGCSLAVVIYGIWREINEVIYY